MRRRWHHVDFQPILLLFVWGGAVRITLTDTVRPIAFDVWPGTWMWGVWAVLMLVCPLMLVAAWWLIDYSRWPRAALAGLWVRLCADIGVLTGLFTFHIATVLSNVANNSESRILSRYIVGAALVYMIVVVARDWWALHRVNRLARTIRG